MFTLLSTGKKSFGKAAADVLNIAVDFAESISSLPASSNSSGGGGNSGGSGGVSDGWVWLMVIVVIVVIVCCLLFTYGGMNWFFCFYVFTPFFFCIASSAFILFLTFSSCNLLFLFTSSSCRTIVCCRQRVCLSRSSSSSSPRYGLICMYLVYLFSSLFSAWSARSCSVNDQSLILYSYILLLPFLSLYSRIQQLPIYTYSHSITYLLYTGPGGIYSSFFSLGEPTGRLYLSVIVLHCAGIEWRSSVRRTPAAGELFRRIV